MSKATERAREVLTAAATNDLDIQIARRHYLNAALDYIEFLNMMQENIYLPPVWEEAYAEAKRKFEEVIHERSD